MFTVLLSWGFAASPSALAQNPLDTIPREVLDNVPHEVLRGDAMLAQGRGDLAEAQFRAAIARVGTNPDLEVRLGMARLAQGDCAGGLALAEPHRAALPWIPRTSALAASCLARQGDHAHAVYFQEEATLLDPESAQLWTMLGVYRRRLGDTVGAGLAFAEADALEPDHPNLAIARGVFALEGGEISRVLDVVEALEQDAVLPHPMARYLYATALMDLGQPQEAAVVARSGLARAPQSPSLGAATAEAERRSGHPELALRILSAGDDTLREGRELVAVAVRTLVDLGDLARARRVLDDARDQVPGSDLAAARWYLARAEGDRGAMARAADDFARYNTSPLRTLDRYLPAATPGSGVDR